MKKSALRIGVVALALVLLFGTTSCARSRENADAYSPDDVPVMATPSVGIGRDGASASGNIFDTTDLPDGVTDAVHTFTVSIDPGHGFMDGGCGEGLYPDGTLEKDITLAVAKKLRDALVACGFEATLTHDGENTPVGDVNQNRIYNIEERVNVVNREKPDYFICLHADFYDDESVSGTRFYAMQSAAKTSEFSVPFAEKLVEAVGQAMPDLPKPRLIDQTNDVGNSYHAIRETTMPATLVELGFLSNPTDRENLVSEDWQNAFVSGLVRGFIACADALAESKTPVPSL